MTARQINAGDVQPIADFIRYVANNWYIGPYYTLATGAAPGAGSIRAYPVFIKQTCTISALGLRITTGAAAGNVQAAIYASTSSGILRPTGTALASTASMATDSTGVFNAAVSVQLAPGLYWFCTNCDNGTAVFSGMSAAPSIWGGVLGSATQGNSLGNNTTVYSVTTAQTFGTWPDLTSATWAENTQASVPVVQFKIGSVP